MTNVIVAFPKIEDAKNIKSVLTRNGINVIAASTTGAYVINVADEVDSGIVVCGYKLADMQYSELAYCLPKGFRMLLVASERHWQENPMDDVVFLPMPLKVHALIETVQMMIETSRMQRKERKPAKRSEEEKNIILNAKRMLMEKNSMSEDEAHRYIQKCSMDSGNSLIETAQMVMSFYG